MALAALAEDLGSVPSTHTRQLTTVHNPSSGGSAISAGTGHTHGAHTYTLAPSDIHKIKTDINFKTYLKKQKRKPRKELGLELSGGVLVLQV